MNDQTEEDDLKLTRLARRSLLVTPLFSGKLSVRRWPLKVINAEKSRLTRFTPFWGTILKSSEKVQKLWEKLATWFFYKVIHPRIQSKQLPRIIIQFLGETIGSLTSIGRRPYTYC